MPFYFRYIVLIIVIFHCISCSHRNNSNNELDYKNYFNSELTINLDSISNFEFNFIQLIDSDDKEQLVNLNKVANTLDFYDIETNQLVKRLFISSDEKFGKFTPRGFYYHNQDSIFLFPGMTLNGTLLLNNNGEVFKKYNLTIPEESEHPLAFNHSSTPTTPTIYYKNKLYGALATLKNTSHGNGLSSNLKTYFTVDLINNEINVIKEHKFPNIYHNRYTNIHNVILSKTYVKEKSIVTSFPLFDSLYIFDLDYNLIEMKLAKSKFFEKFIDVPKNLPQEDHYISLISESSYGRIIHDPYRNLYYRFVLIGRPITDLDNDIMDSNKNQFSILVLDKDFEFLKEVVFPGSTYFNYSAFVGKKGLYLPKINSYNKEISEDYIKYDIFNFEKE